MKGERKLTRKLSEKEKDKRREERKKRRQQRAASPTVKTVQVPAEKPADQEVNLCDDCAYEFGDCAGSPKFAGPDDDRVVGCSGFINVSSMPTAGELEGSAGAPASAPAEGAIYEGPINEDEVTDEGPDIELTQVTDAQGKPRVEGAFKPQRPDPKRFLKDTMDYGTCQSCSRRLKRTAYSEYVDAVRCTNPRCHLYREIVQQVKTGVK